MKKYIFLMVLILLVKTASSMENKWQRQPFLALVEEPVDIEQIGTKKLLEKLKCLPLLNYDWELNAKLISDLENLYVEYGSCNEEIIKIYNDNNNNNTFAFKEKIVGFPFANTQKTITELLSEKENPIALRYWQILSMHKFDLNEPLNDGETLKKKIIQILENPKEKSTTKLTSNCFKVLKLIVNSKEK